MALSDPPPASAVSSRPALYWTPTSKSAMSSVNLTHNTSPHLGLSVHKGFLFIHQQILTKPLPTLVDVEGVPK